jgi:hypothetical protein
MTGKKRVVQHAFPIWSPACPICIIQGEGTVKMASCPVWVHVVQLLTCYKVIEKHGSALGDAAFDAENVQERELHAFYSDEKKMERGEGKSVRN